MPKIEIVIASVAPPILGETYHLICNVTGTDNLCAITTYHWTKDNGTKISLKTNISNYYFPTFRLSDAGNYSCEVNVNSTYLDDRINAYGYIPLEISSKCFILSTR